MFEQIVHYISDYPYIGVAVAFVLCGLGLPLPEEIGLLAVGYLCAKFPDRAQLPLMMAWSAGAILTGDLLPYLGGRLFGVRLLRLRWLRFYVNKQRLARLDLWFRRRGDMVILIARFIAGLRVVAFFFAGSMRMSAQRFLFLDGLGIALIVPAFTLLGFHSAPYIEDVIAKVQEVERGLLWAVVGLLGLGLAWYWLWQRRLRLRQEQRPAETFVQPQRPVWEATPDPTAPPPATGERPPAGPPPCEPPAPPTAS